MGRMVAWMGVAAGAVYLIYIGGGWQGIYTPSIRLATVAIAAVALLAWTMVAWRLPSWRPRTALWPAILAVLASLTFSTIVSRDPRVSFEYLGYVVVLMALYLLLVRLFASEFFRSRLIAVFTMLFAVSTVLYLGQVASGWLDWWSATGHFAVPPLRPGFAGLTYNNPSAALTMVALLAIAPAATYGRSNGRGRVVVVAILAAIGTVALLSGSRAGWLALGITSLAGPVAWLAVSANRASVRETVKGLLRTRTARIAALASAVLAAGILLVLSPAILRRALEGGEDLRVAYWVAAVRMFAAAPVLGTGPGTWVIQRPAFTSPPELDTYIPHAHNLEFQTLAELGVVGVVAGVVVVVTVARLFVEASRSADRERRRWAWAGGLGLTYFALHQLLDVYVNMPAFLLASVIPVAYLDATSPTISNIPGSFWRPHAHAAFIGLAGIVSAAIAGLLLQEVPAADAARAVDAANAGNWPAALAPSKRAAAADPDIGSYQLIAGLSAAHAGDDAAAAQAFEVLTSRADLPEGWLNLAAEQRALGESSDAVRSVTAAMRLGYQRAAIAMPAGELALRLGDHALADRAFAAAIADRPSLAGDPWWQEYSERRDALARALPLALAQQPSIRWETDLELGRFADARHLVTPGTIQAILTDAWAGITGMTDQVFAYCHDNPLDVDMLNWCARTAERLGDNVAVERYRAEANIINLGSAYGAGEVRVNESGRIDRVLAGDPADFWATYTYRRPGPWDVLVPSLIHLELW